MEKLLVRYFLLRRNVNDKHVKSAKEDMDIQRRNHRNRKRKVITFPRAAWIYEQLIIGIPNHRNTIIGSTVGHIIVIAWLVYLWTSMKGSSYDQLFIMLFMAWSVFLLNILPFSVQREPNFNFRDGIENICLSISCPRRDRDFLSFNLVLRDEHENFST